MEISNENVYKVGYTSVLGGNSKNKKKSTSRILKFIGEHKIITTSIIIFLMCCTLNFILIYNFMKILANSY